MSSIKHTFDRNGALVVDLHSLFTSKEFHMQIEAAAKLGQQQKLDESRIQMGREAYRSGRTYEDCPFQSANLRNLWFKGWREEADRVEKSIAKQKPHTRD